MTSLLTLLTIAGCILAGLLVIRQVIRRGRRNRHAWYLQLVAQQQLDYLTLTALTAMRAAARQQGSGDGS